MVHRLHDLSDLTETVPVEMQMLIHHLENSRELAELFSLCRSQWICLEEGNDG